MLMIAAESGKEKDIFNAIIDVIEACSVDVNARELKQYEFEYLFLKIRSASVGETTNVLIPCSSCGKDVKQKINLEEIKPSEPKGGIEKTIMIGDVIGIELKELTIADIEEAATGDEILDGIIAMIDFIFDDKKVYKKDETPVEELKQFAESLTRPTMNKIEAYAKSMPQLTKEIEFDCPHCKAKNSHILKGMSSFFDSLSVTTR